MLHCLKLLVEHYKMLQLHNSNPLRTLMELFIAFEGVDPRSGNDGKEANDLDYGEIVDPP